MGRVDNIFDLFKIVALASNAWVNYCRSYQDYTLSLMQEWWKRGVSIYWDNTYLRQMTNPWMSDAYISDDGRRQPALTLWNQRKYMKRT